MDSLSYAQRQYKLMVEYLEYFEKGNLKLIKLINSLESLVDVLENTSKEWKSSFREEWLVLEEIYAVASDKAERISGSFDESQIYKILEEDKDLIHKTVENLKSLVQKVYKGCTEFYGNSQDDLGK